MARPPFQPSDVNRRQVKIMAALGMRQEEIAKAVDITPKTMRKHFRHELDMGAIEANAKVIETLLFSSNR